MLYEVHLSIPLALAIPPPNFFPVTTFESISLILSKVSTCYEIPNQLEEEEMMALLSKIEPLLLIQMAHCLRQLTNNDYYF